MRLLLAEDDPQLRELLTEALTEFGWHVSAVADGTEALRTVAAEPVGFDVMVLDWMLPGMAGPEVARTLRAHGHRLPILMLTARGSVADRIQGLDDGCDDYLVKPFDLGELVARLRALVRRGEQPAGVLQVGDLVLDPDTRTARRGEASMPLSEVECTLLTVLLRNCGQVISRDQLHELVWGPDAPSSNAVDVNIARIRTKIDRPFGTQTIRTVRNLGYIVDRPKVPR